MQSKTSRASPQLLEFVLSPTLSPLTSVQVSAAVQNAIHSHAHQQTVAVSPVTHSHKGRLQRTPSLENIQECRANRDKVSMRLMCKWTDSGQNGVNISR